MLSKLIKIKGGFVRAIKISDDFFDKELNQRKLESYYVNPSAREAFYSISRGLHPTSRNRVHLISGTYGSGKSHFGLVIANYLTKNSSSEGLEMIFHRIRKKDPSKADEIYRIRNIDRPYLIILLEGHDPDGAEHALLKGLKDALTRDGVPEEVLKTSYQSALRKIEEWENRKPAFVEQLSLLLAKKGGNIATIDDLRERLNLFKEDAYRLFKEIHSEITLSPFQTLYNEKASQIYPQLSELLIKEYERKGIVIIWDQFDEHVRKTGPSYLSREESFLRNFVEIVERSGDSQLHLILISHHPPHTYLRGEISEEALHNWERIFKEGGRCQQYTLTAIDESEELIDYAITQQRDNPQWEELEDKIEKSTKLIDRVIELGLFPEKERNWVMDTICRGAFPLHPIATYCLPRISDVVGQAERTMFTFFEEENKEGGLTKFINENPPMQEGKLNFYTADKLFDFFKEAIESTLGTHHVVRNHDEAMGKVKDRGEILTQRVMKALAVINTIKTEHPVIPLLATSHNLGLLLNIEESRVKPLLSSLVENQVLWIRANSEYDFRTGQAIVDFGEDFAKVKEGLRWDNPILELKSVYPPDDIVARGYERDYRVIRKLFADYIDASGLDNIKQYENQIKNEYKDGAVLYVVAESNDEIEEAKRKAVNIKNPQIVIVIPKYPLKIYDTLKNVKAIEQLKEKPAYTSENTQTYREWKDRYDNEKQKLDTEINNWRAITNLYWFWGGESLDTTGKKDSDIADSVMNKVFDKTPVVEHEKTANRLMHDSQKADRKKLNTAILDIKQEEIAYQAKGTAPAEKTILEQTFNPQGMLKKRTSGNFDYYKFVEPTIGNMKAVWEKMKKDLMEAGANPNLPKMVKELQLSPLGLCPRAIELFLSTFLKRYRNHFTIKTKRTKSEPSQRRDFTGETIYDVVNSPDPEKVLIEYRPSLPHESYYLENFWYVTFPDKDWNKLYSIDFIGELFIEWLQNLPKVTRFAVDFSTDTRNFIDAFKNANKDMNLRELLIENLPSVLGFDKKFNQWDEGDIDKFISSYKKVVEEINNYPEYITKKIRRIFREIFDVKGDTEYDIMEKIKHWYNELDRSVKEHTFIGNAFRLMKFSNIQRMDQFGPKFQIELPKEMGLGAFTEWEDVKRSLENYQRFVTSAKLEIEKFHKKVAKPAVKPPKLSKDAELLKTSLKEKIRKAKIKKEEIIRLLEELLEEYKK
jgi:hypothetical protein